MKTTDEYFQETDFLKSLHRDDLYQYFHKIQFEALRPHWDSHLNFIVENFHQKKITEVFGPKSPTIPETNTASLLNQIKNASAKDILVLQHVMSFIEDPLTVLAVARTHGFKTVVIHDSSRDGSFRYDCSPYVEHFQIRTRLTHEKHGQSEGNPALIAVIDQHPTIGYRITSDTLMTIEYKTPEQKKQAVLLELALDLIEHKFGDSPSEFTRIQEQLRPWCFDPDSWLKVSGASRFVVLSCT